MTELHLGLCRAKDIAEWFGIKPGSYSAHKAKKLEELSNYCEFEDLGKKGINITHIYNSTYTKTSTRELVDKEFFSIWSNDNNNINTSRAVAKIMYAAHPELTISPETLYQAICVKKRTDYGVPKKKSGIQGNSKWVFCVYKEIDGIKHYRHFTPEELAIKQSIYRKYEIEMSEFIEELYAVKLAINDNEMLASDLSNYIESLSTNSAFNWSTFQEQFEKAIHQHCCFATELEPGRWDLNNFVWEA